MSCFFKKRLKEELCISKAFIFIRWVKNVKFLYDTFFSHILLSIISSKLLSIQNFEFYQGRGWLALLLDPANTLISTKLRLGSFIYLLPYNSSEWVTGHLLGFDFRKKPYKTQKNGISFQEILVCSPRFHMSIYS